jgi:hypothetical protein
MVLLVVAFGIAGSARTTIGQNKIIPQKGKPGVKCIDKIDGTMPNDISMPRTAVGVDVSKTIQLKNSGTVAEKVTIAVTNYAQTVFKVSPTSFTLAVGATQTVTITYKPTAIGHDSGYVWISYLGCTPTGKALSLNYRLSGDCTFADDVATISIANPKSGEQKSFGTVWQPAAFFRSVGLRDEFDVPVSVDITRCSDGVVVFHADGKVPELNTADPPALFNFPSTQGAYDVSKLPAGCYNICATAHLPSDGNHSNDKACGGFSIIKGK